MKWIVSSGEQIILFLLFFWIFIPHKICHHVWGADHTRAYFQTQMHSRSVTSVAVLGVRMCSKLSSSRWSELRAISPHCPPGYSSIHNFSHLRCAIFVVTAVSKGKHYAAVSYHAFLDFHTKKGGMKSYCGQRSWTEGGVGEATQCYIMNAVVILDPSRSKQKTRSTTQHIATL